MSVTNTYDRVQINEIVIRINADNTLSVVASGALAGSDIDQPDRQRRPFGDVSVPLTTAQHTAIRNNIGAAILPMMRSVLGVNPATATLVQTGNVFVETPL